MSETWCARCGYPYELRDGVRMPTCECAGDPPVDKTGDDWQLYLRRVRDHEWTAGHHRA